MGCDIHAFIEVKTGGQWHFAGSAKISRRYGVFGILAGVREDGPQFPVKGMPSDATVPVKKMCDEGGSDGHTHSWLTSIELARLKRIFEEWDEENEKNPQPGASEKGWYRKEFGRVGRTDILDFIDDRLRYGIEDTSDKWIEDIRLVFWFDN